MTAHPLSIIAEAAGRLQQAAIALRKQREKNALARTHRRVFAVFFRKQKSMTLAALADQQHLFTESYYRLSEGNIYLTLAQWDRMWETIAGDTFKDLQQAVFNAEVDGIVKGAEQMHRSVGYDRKTSFSLVNPRAVEWFQQKGGSIDLIKGIQQTTADQLKRLVSTAIEEGHAYTEIAKDISDRFDDMTRSRAQRIAVYETGSAYEKGNFLFAKSLEDDGTQMQEQWTTSHDERVRPEHTANEDEGWVELGHIFSSGNTEPPTDPGCRCYMLYREAPVKE